MSVVVMVFLLISIVMAGSNIVDSPHNLSISGKGTIKAISEKEICVFCHIPHHEGVGLPLWNHLLSSQDYTLYESEFLKRTGYPLPVQPSKIEGQPGIVSRMCLSCHDGTVAVGGVYWVRGTNLYDLGQKIEMTGVNPDGTIPSTEEGYIGTDLRSHHPVAIPYDPSFIYTVGGTPKSIELRNPDPSPPIKLYEYGGIKYVECASCHDPHRYDPVVNKKFLRIDSGNTFGENVLNTCIACHTRTGWTTSSHSTSTATYSDPSVSGKYGVNTVSSLGCVNCHIPHKGLGIPYLLRWSEEQTCFKGVSGSSTSSACHGTGANNPKIIEPLLGRTYSHPVTAKSGIHTNLDYLFGTGNPPDPPGSGGITFDNYRHAECVDCHNPHQTAQGNHATPPDTRDVLNAGWYPQNPTNLVSNVLKGVGGVEPVWTGPGTQPTNYSVIPEASYEYQICFKCHSYWSLGISDKWRSSFFFSDGRTTDAGTPYPLTDVAAEFNINNASGHPVVVSSNNRPGSYSPRALPPEAMREPWRSSVGNVAMYCSDCHGSDNEVGGDPRGPHGSNLKFMLKGPGKYWPKDPSGNLYRIADVTSGAQDPSNLFCNNCHDIPWIMNNVSPHDRWPMTNLYCVNCHVAIPHGSTVSRLIGYCYFPEPYNYRDPNGIYYLRLWGWKKDYDGGSWNLGDRGDAWSENPSCDGRMCHSFRTGGYDCYYDSPFVTDCGEFDPAVNAQDLYPSDPGFSLTQWPAQCFDRNP